VNGYVDIKLRDDEVVIDASLYSNQISLPMLPKRTSYSAVTVLTVVDQC